MWKPTRYSFGVGPFWSGFWGDPHYETFDMATFDYQGTSKFNLASPCTQEPGIPYFQVFSRNENRDGNTQVSYPMYVEVVNNGATVRLARSGSTIPVKVTV
jgi:hypothetical protein